MSLQIGGTNKMIKVKEFEDMYIELFETIESEIELVNKGLKKRSNHQLETIINDVKIMIKIKDSNLFLPSYPRFIIDSWDYNDSLGIELLKFNELYRKIKN